MGEERRWQWLTFKTLSSSWTRRSTRLPLTWVSTIMASMGRQRFSRLFFGEELLRKSLVMTVTVTVEATEVLELLPDLYCRPSFPPNGPSFIPRKKKKKENRNINKSMMSTRMPSSLLIVFDLESEWVSGHWREECYNLPSYSIDRDRLGWVRL